MSANTVVWLSPYTWRSNLKRDVPQEDQNTCKDTVSRGKFTSPEIPVIVNTFNMGGISDFGHGWWLPMFEPN